MAQKHWAGEQFQIGLLLNSEGQTLGVPAGWDKPASRFERKLAERLRKPVGEERCE